MQFFLKLAVGLMLSALLLYFVDWQQSIAILLSISPVPAFFAFLVLSQNILISSWKWQILLFAHGASVSLWRLTRIYWISTFLGNYMPTSFGGDVFRLVMMRDVGSKAMVAASIAVERLTGFLVLLVLSALCLLMRPAYFDKGYLLPLLWLFVGACCLAFVCLVVFGKFFTDQLNRLSCSGFVGKIVSKFLRFIDAVAQYHGNKKELAIAVLISFCFYFVLILCNYLILISVGADIPFKEVCFIAPIIPLISMLPVSLNGLGISEGAYVLFFTQAGVSPSYALAAAILRRLNHLLVSLVGCAFWLPTRSSENK